MTSLSKSAFLSAIISAEWSGKIIVFILFVISVFTLAIFIRKIKDFKRITASNKSFLNAFRSAVALEELYKIKENFSGPLLKIFEQGYLHKESKNVSAYIDESILKEKQQVGSYLVFLASAITISPFLGLLGTVWGILVAFMDIRNYGSAHINVVAPGIAESLVTTVVGLLVAIPALLFYNFSTNRANNLSDEIEIFSRELIDRLSIYTQTTHSAGQN